MINDQNVKANANELDDKVLDIEMTNKVNSDLQKENTINEEINNNNNNSILCDICYEAYDSNNYNSIVIIIPCRETICQSCLKLYILHKIKTCEVENIKCPNHKCKENYIFTEEVIKLLIDESDFLTFQRLARRNNLRKNPNIVLCPFSECESFAYKNNLEGENQLDNIDNFASNENIKNNKNLNVKLLINQNDDNITIENTFITCLNNHNFCYKCNQQPHYGLKCEVKIESEFQNYVNVEKIKNCPNCQYFIKKSEGCNHVTCGNPQCKYEYCWICMALYSPSHYTDFTSGCYGLQNASESDLLVRFKFLRKFNFIFILLFRILMVILLVTIPTIVISIIVIIDEVINNQRGYFMMVYPSLRSGLGKFIYRCVTALFIFLMSIAMISVGYFSVIMAVLCFPFIFVMSCAITLYFTIGTGRRLFMYRRRIDEENI